jgi:hypothetical protein
MDEVNLDAFLREASEAIDDPESLTHFLREKATIAVERFLVSLNIYLCYVFLLYDLTITI